MARMARMARCRPHPARPGAWTEVRRGGLPVAFRSSPREPVPGASSRARFAAPRAGAVRVPPLAFQRQRTMRRFAEFTGVWSWQ